MSRLTLLCLAALVAVAGAEPQPPLGRKAKTSRPAAPAPTPVDPYAAPVKPPRSAAKGNDSSPVDPYAISTSAAQAAYSIASRHVVELRKEALQLVTARLTSRQPVTEYEVMQVIMRGMAARGLVGPSPSVATGVNTDNAYYVPTAQRTSQIQVGDPIVIFIAGRIDSSGDPGKSLTRDSAGARSTPDDPGKSLTREEGVRRTIDRQEGVLASQTWCAVADKTVPAPIAKAFETIRLARDRAIAVARNRSHSHRTPADQRPQPSFIVGQGIYFAGSFGLRSEVSLYLGSPKPDMTPTVQLVVQTLLP